MGDRRRRSARRRCSLQASFRSRQCRTPPDNDKELSRKLKKAQKNMPAFGWETEPVMDGREEIVEEGFIDVFCDLLYSGGWLDRGEEVFRDCNWALVRLC